MENQENQVNQANSKKNKKRIIFWTRFAGYVITGLLIPMIFLIWRFNLFEKVSKVSIGGWGLVCIIFAGVFLICLAKQVKKGLPYSFFTQCLTGFYKIIIPLAIVTAACFVCKDCIEKLFHFFAIVTVSEMFAIPLNPLPAWIHSQSEKEDEDKFLKFAKIFWDNKEEK